MGNLIDNVPPGMVQLTYWVDFIHPAGSGRWSNALSNEDNEEKAWASVKQLRCWYFAHRVSVLRFDPLSSPRSEMLRAAEWNRLGRQVSRIEGRLGEFPEWMMRDVIEEDRIPPPARM